MWYYTEESKDKFGYRHDDAEESGEIICSHERKKTDTLTELVLRHDETTESKVERNAHQADQEVAIIYIVYYSILS